ncbi:MAG: efflux RND transporter periplasmic adaptor subunit [Dehalococcoidia bacterium]|nr:efflux RND transporter periplasmic adaptor subunit [Dehalococcoidia bacterium]
MKKRVAIFLAITLAALPLAACAGNSGNEVPTAKVTKEDVRVTISVSGNLDATEDRFLTFATPGTIDEILVEKGDRVATGDAIARLNTDDLQRNIDAARLNLQAAQAQYEIADNQLRQTIYPHYYSSYVIDVPGTWMALDKAIKNVEEARALMEKGDVAESNLVLDDALNDIADAQHSSQSRQWDLPLPVKVMELQREAAGIAVKAAQLNLDAVQDMLQDAMIEAPFPGVITTTLVKEGDILTSMNYFNPAFRIVDPAHLEMTGLIDEMDIAQISMGQKAIVTMDALPGVEVEGTVTYISAAAMIEAGVVMYQTTITLENPDPAIRDGMSATADIILQEHKGVLVVPRSAVTISAGQATVYVVADGDMVVRDIVLGLPSGQLYEVESGLSEGELVSLEPPK